MNQIISYVTFCFVFSLYILSLSPFVWARWGVYWAHSPYQSSKMLFQTQIFSRLSISPTVNGPSGARGMLAKYFSLSQFPSNSAIFISSWEKVRSVIGLLRTNSSATNNKFHNKLTWITGSRTPLPPMYVSLSLLTFLSETFRFFFFIFFLSLFVNYWFGTFRFIWLLFYCGRSVI